MSRLARTLVSPELSVQGARHPGAPAAKGPGKILLLSPGKVVLRLLLVVIHLLSASFSNKVMNTSVCQDLRWLLMIQKRIKVMA